jgi:hypothetical protein
MSSTGQIRLPKSHGNMRTHARSYKVSHICTQAAASLLIAHSDPDLLRSMWEN